MSNDQLTRAELLEQLEELKEALKASRARLDEILEDRNALQRRESELQRLLNDLPSEFFFYRHDSDGVFTFVSPSVTRMLGHDRADFLAHYSKYMTDSEINKRAVEMTNLSLSGVQPPQYQVEILHRDGSVRLLEVVESPVLDESGRVAAVEGVARDITRRERAEAALRVSDERFRTAFGQAPAGMMLISEEGIVMNANDAMCAILGYAAGELTGMDCLAITHPEDRPATLEAVERLRRKAQSSCHMNKRYLRRDGSPVRCEVGIHAVHDAGGLPSGFFVHVTDVTEMEAALDELTRVRRDWEAVFRAVAQPMMLLSPDRTVLDANDAMAELIGLSVEKVKGLKCHDAIHGGGVPDGCPLSAMISSGKAESREMPVEISGRTCIVSCTPVTDTDGRLEKVIHAAVDITARNLAEKALAASEEKFRAFFENAAELCFILNPEGCVTDLNRAAESALGITRAEAFGKSLGSLFDSVSGGRLDGILQALVADPGSESLELEVCTKPGIRLFVLLSACVIGDNVGGHRQCIVTMRDVTQSRLLQQELAHSQKMESVGRLAGGVAHDFNNVLTVIFGRCDLLLARLPPDDPIASDVMQIRECATRSAGITRQLLAFSRKQVASPVFLDLNSVIGEMKGMLTHLIGEDVELIVQLEEDIPTVRADKTQIEQVVMNLVLNARDAMPNGGTLTLRTGRIRMPEDMPALSQRLSEGEYTALHVADTGTGMDNAVMDRLFEPFFTTKEPGRGGGLGLSTVYGIVSQSGGTILVESKPGEGSTFSIYLPASGRQVSSVGRSSQPSGALSGTETILLIEDEASVRLMLAEMLREAGYEVLDSRSGEEALELFRSLDHPPDLILSDIVLPGISGPDAVSIMSTASGIAVLFMSGYCADESQWRGTTKNGPRFIQKPFTPQELLGRIRYILDGREG